MRRLIYNGEIPRLLERSEDIHLPQKTSTALKGGKKNQNRVLLCPDEMKSDKNLIYYILKYKNIQISKKVEAVLKALVDTPNIYITEKEIIIRLKKIKFKIKINGTLTTDLLKSKQNILENAVCLLLKLSNYNIFWSDSIHEGINLLSCSLAPRNLRSHFCQSTNNEYFCAFQTFNCIPLEGNFYAIIDINRFPSLFEKFLIYALRAILYSNEKDSGTGAARYEGRGKLNISLYIISKTHPIITNKVILNLFDPKINEATSLDKLSKSTQILTGIQDVYSINNCSLVNIHTDMIKYLLK